MLFGHNTRILWVHAGSEREGRWHCCSRQSIPAAGEARLAVKLQAGQSGGIQLISHQATPSFWKMKARQPETPSWPSCWLRALSIWLQRLLWLELFGGVGGGVGRVCAWTPSCLLQPVWQAQALTAAWGCQHSKHRWKLLGGTAQPNQMHH